jgi:hypothetical protein
LLSEAVRHHTDVMKMIMRKIMMTRTMMNMVKETTLHPVIGIIPKKMKETMRKIMTRMMMDMVMKIPARIPVMKRMRKKMTITTEVVSAEAGMKMNMNIPAGEGLPGGEDVSPAVVVDLLPWIVTR